MYSAEFFYFCPHRKIVLKIKICQNCTVGKFIRKRTHVVSELFFFPFELWAENTNP